MVIVREEVCTLYEVCLLDLMDWCEVHRLLQHCCHGLKMEAASTFVTFSRPKCRSINFKSLHFLPMAGRHLPFSGQSLFLPFKSVFLHLSSKYIFAFLWGGTYIFSPWYYSSNNRSCINYSNTIQQMICHMGLWKYSEIMSQKMQKFWQNIFKNYKGCFK